MTIFQKAICEMTSNESRRAVTNTCLGTGIQRLDPFDQFPAELLR
jgi:hypothetical protein